MLKGRLDPRFSLEFVSNTLFVIWVLVEDTPSAVHLFGPHYSNQWVRQSERRQRPTHVGALQAVARQAVRPSNEKAVVAVLHRPVSQVGSELLSAPGFSLHIESHHPVAAANRRQHLFTFSCDGFVGRLAFASRPQRNFNQLTLKISRHSTRVLVVTGFHPIRHPTTHGYQFQSHNRRPSAQCSPLLDQGSMVQSFSRS